MPVELSLAEAPLLKKEAPKTQKASADRRCPRNRSSEREGAPQRGIVGGVPSSQGESQVGHMKRCKAAQGLWKVVLGNTVVGYFLVYVDDVRIAAKTMWILSMMKAFGKTGNVSMWVYS